MSIINQTLRALDARTHETAPLQMPLRPVAVPVSRRIGRGLAVLVAVLAVGAATAWLLTRPDAVPVSAEPVAAVALPEPVAVLADAVPPETLPEAMPQVEQAAPVQPALAAPAVATAAPPATPLPPAPAAAEPQKPSPSAAIRPPLIQKSPNPSSPEDAAEDRYRKAVALLQKDRVNPARLLLEEALDLYPAHVAARQTLAALLSEAGRNAEAEAVLRAGRVAVPGNAWFALSLARLQAARGEARLAAATLQEGLGGRGIDADYHATLAALLVQLDRHAEAAHHYRQALASRPGEGSWWMGLGIALAAEGKSGDARAAYERALASGNLPDTLAGFVRAKLAE